MEWVNTGDIIRKEIKGPLNGSYPTLDFFDEMTSYAHNNERQGHRKRQWLWLAKNGTCTSGLLPIVHENDNSDT
jgi:hypothetical protein